MFIDSYLFFKVRASSYLNYRSIYAKTMLGSLEDGSNGLIGVGGGGFMMDSLIYLCSIERGL